MWFKVWLTRRTDAGKMADRFTDQCPALNPRTFELALRCQLSYAHQDSAHRDEHGEQWRNRRAAV